MYCKQGIIGVQFSHNQRGHGLCCSTHERYNDSPLKVWQDKLADARHKISKNTKVTACTSCYSAEEKGVKSFRQTYNDQFKNFTETNLPQHMDLDFSTLCNLKCIMCGPDRSSTWAKEKNLFTATNGVTSITAEDLEEVCRLSADLKYITLQGGEPTLVNEYQTYFQYLKDNNIIKNVSLNVVTNLTNLNTKFFSYLPYFKDVSISVSVDAFGLANDYIRYPSKFSKITNNIKNLNQFDNVNVKVDTAIQILSMFNIDHFNGWIKDLDSHFKKNNQPFQQYVQHVWMPECLHINNAPDTLKKQFIQSTQNTAFEHLTKSFKSSSYDTKKTLQFLDSIDVARNISVVDFIPELGLHYQI
jgi:molybdenum cofactor biosynthesis enzyme MoaA